MSYSQEIYDAARSRISPIDGSSIERIAQDAFDISYAKQLMQQEIAAVGYEYQRPCVVFRPSLSIDGSMWCALLGDDLQTGVAGFGETPAAAMTAFDQAFWKGRTPIGQALAKEPRP